jgi:RNA polymerase subunit RPABC4/transcription elongation factor Spt4
MHESRNQITPERQLMFYGGMGLMGLGLVLFLSVFVTGGFAYYGEARALGGIILLMIGNFLKRIGERGWAGSGVILDPDKARTDLEPWSRMAGGVVQDALTEVDRATLSQPQVKVRCLKCQNLNDETAKFCQQCGARI